MRTSIHTIKFVTSLSVIFALFAYCISVNGENKWLVLNTPWLSNSFAFAVTGGSFVSLIVILVCEFQKYFFVKHQIEDYTYSQLFALYSQITIIHYNTKRQLNELDTPVPLNLIDDISNRGLLCLNNLNTIDFVTFRTKNVIKDILNQYNGKNGMDIRSFLQYSAFLKIAINEDKIAKLKQGRDGPITSKSPKAQRVLKKINIDSSVILTYIEKSIEQIDKECKYRYHWKDVKRNIISSEENYVTIDLADFLKLPTIKFQID